MKKLSYILAALMLIAVLTVAVACDRQVTLTFNSDGQQIAAVSGKAGSDITDRLPSDPERDGYVFEGWYLTPDGSGERQVLPQTMPQNSATYYAKWSEDGENVVVTLTTSDGGTLPASGYRVPRGTVLSEFLADKQPTPIDGLTFAGWFVGNTPLPATLAVQEDITLTAKYNAEYTLTIHTMDTSGRYTQTQTVTGTAFYGERFNCGSAMQVPDHFELDTLVEGSRLSTGSLAVNDVFEAYLLRERCYVTYNAALPAGVTYSGGGLTSYYYGTSVAVDESVISPDYPYRLLGWATLPNGEITYPSGENFVVDGEMNLYGVWETGYRDTFGGSDEMYPVTGEPGKLRLVRTNAEDVFGTYNEQTGLFNFEIDGNTLSGCLNLNGSSFVDNVFYYYHDVLEQTYPDLDGSDDTLTLLSQGKVVYRHNGEDITGYYVVDIDTGYSRFVSDDGQTSFLYNLFEETSTGKTLFRRQNMQEAGRYATDDGFVIELDGLGGLTYRYNAQNYQYQYSASQPVLEIFGYYEWQPENNFFLAYTRDATSILFRLVFTIDREARVDSVPGYSYTSYDGRIHRDDGYRGTYSDKWESTTNQLYLDGFGSGEYGNVTGTYTLVEWEYVYADEETESDAYGPYRLVRFVGTDNTVYYFRMDVDYGDFEIDRIIPANEVREDLRDAFGRHDFDHVYVDGYDYNIGFVYVFENGGAEMWTAAALLENGEYAYVLYIEYVSQISERESGGYLFGSEQNGEPAANSMYFELNGDGTLTQTFPEVHRVDMVWEDGDESIKFDRTTGVATYTQGQKEYDVEVGIAEGYIDYYVFRIVRTNTYRYFMRIDGTYYEFGPENALLASEESAEELTARLWQVNGKAYIGFMLDNSLFRVIGEGTITPVEGSENEFDFVLGEWSALGLTASDLEGWMNFRFRTYSEGTVHYFERKQTDVFGFSNLSTDGYGTYTFTDEQGTVEGLLYNTVTDPEGNILLLYLLSDSVRAFAAQDGKLVRTDADHAGIWYEMNDNLLIGLNYFFVFDGLGNVTYYVQNTLLYTYTITHGTYTPTERWSRTFKEYDIVTDEGGAFYNGTTAISRVLLDIYTVENQATLERLQLPVYQRQIPHRVGEFEIIGGGSISSLGYPGVDAIYTDSWGVEYHGNMYLGTVTKDGMSGPEFNNTADNPTTVRFWIMSTNTSFYFEIVGSRLMPHILTFGDYAYFDGNNTDLNWFVRLEGGGNAYIYNGLRQADRGTYTRVEELDAFRYKSATYDFVFRLGYEATDSSDVYVFYVYSKGEDNLYRSETDLATLDIDGFGNAVYVDNYGRVYEGYYAIFDQDNCYGYFGSQAMSRVFVLDKAKGTFRFEDNSKYTGLFFDQNFNCFEFGDATVTFGGQSYYYVAGEDEITAYGDEGTFTLPLPTGDSYLYDGKTYYRYDGNPITFTDSEFEDKTLTLTFTPSGGTFNVAASLNGNASDYSVSVTYGETGAAATLIYFTGSTDTLQETYALTLHFGSGSNTFTVEAQGLDGKFADDSHPSSYITLGGKRVGHVLVGDNSVTYNFDYFTDSADGAFAGTGVFDQLTRSVQDYNWNYGDAYVGKMTAGDGKEYTVTFFVDTAERQVILVSVTVERTFGAAVAGEQTQVTVAQSWFDPSGEHAQRAITDIALPRDGVTTTVVVTTWDNGAKAALVRQARDTTSGAYAFRTTVFDLTYDADGFVNGLTADDSYSYGYATQPASETDTNYYDVQFLYSYQNGVFTVYRILTFTVGAGGVVQADYSAGDAPNTFVATVGEDTYTLSFSYVAGQFTLTVTRG